MATAQSSSFCLDLGYLILTVINGDQKLSSLADAGIYQS